MDGAREFLARAEGEAVVVQFKEERKLRGRLVGSDEFINLVLADVEEEGPHGTRKMEGRVVVRGSQVVGIHATKLKAAPVAGSGGHDAPRAQEWSYAEDRRRTFRPRP